MERLASFADRDGWIWLDGAWTSWRQARLHVLSHGLHYGSAVFEGVRAYGGTPFALRAHTDRLFRSAEILDFAIPFSRDAIDRACREVCEKNGLSEAYIRPIAWRGSGSMGVAAATARAHVAVAAWAWPSYFAPAGPEPGVRLTFARYRRPAPDCAPVEAKAAGLYMISTLEKQAAERAGFDDALMLDHTGQVAESTGANIFLVRDGGLHTPRADRFLDGITRRTVIALARGKGLQVVERRISPDELATFSEAFLVGTAAEVAPVAQIGPHRFRVGPVALELTSAYARHVRRPLGAEAAPASA